MSFAHLGGVPAEEVLLPLTASATALLRSRWLAPILLRATKEAGSWRVL
jgi:hypothetical protein